MTLTESVTKNIIIKLIKGEDYRIEIVTLINATFLQYVIDFFKRVIDAKLKSKKIDTDWYKKEFLNPKLSSNEIAIHSGLNRKTITNMYNTAKKEIVIDASNDHYDNLYEAIKNLVETEHEIDITLTIKFKGVSVDLNVSESLIVINTLAVKRAELRGGLWSTAGKRVEKPLMIALCKIFGLSNDFYKVKVLGKQIDDTDFEREIDFYLCNPKLNKEYKCEVKLMGRGNPESADAVIARGSKVFVADKLSDLNKKQLDKLRVEWVELHKGYKRFGTVLSNLKIPHSDFKGNIDLKLEEIFKKIF